MKPDEVLDMSLPMFNACVAGYSEHIFDLQLLTVHTGFWAGYYSNSKKPKKLGAVLKSIIKNKESASKKPSQCHVPDVDVEAFLEQERRFKERAEKYGYVRK